MISGNRPPLNEIAEQSPRFAGYDGRWPDLPSDVPTHLMPWISDRWVYNFNWNGDGSISDKERQKLERIVAAAHQHGRKVRFWATAEKPAVWQVLLEAKVDLINTDRLVELRQFFLSQNKK